MQLEKAPEDPDDPDGSGQSTTWRSFQGACFVIDCQGDFGFDEGGKKSTMTHPAQFGGFTEKVAFAFPTTHWSVVLTASQSGSSAGQDALARLCGTYWHPLYGYVRRRGHGPHDSEDLTQAFFARLLEKEYLSLADSQRGRFRTFLLTALQHFLINEWEKSRAQRRGGEHQFVSWDAEEAEGRFLAEPADGSTPEMIYEKRWAATLLEQVLRRLREEAKAASRQPLFEKLKDYLWGEDDKTTYDSIARELGMSETAVKGAAHRLRQRFRESLRAEIAQTVARDEEIEDELRHLIAVMSG